MIFTSVYGFNNMPRSFYLMGYGAIPFFLLSAVVFFVPFAFMVAEYGSAFKDEKGGIFSWMQICVGKKYAFVANSGLDPKTSLVIDELIQDITREYNMTTLINTHDKLLHCTPSDKAAVQPPRHLLRCSRIRILPALLSPDLDNAL